MIGIFSKTIDPNLSKIAGLAGLDFIILDMEHGISNLRDIQNHINYSNSLDIKSYVRIESADSKNIHKILELEPNGIMVPNVMDYNHWKEIKRRLYFHPKGDRGICRFVPAANFGNTPSKEYFSKENSKKIILQIEGTKSLLDIESFIEDSEIDTIFIGPYDLSQSLGIPGEIDNPLLELKIKEIVKSCNSKKNRVGLFVDNHKQIKKWRNAGINFIACSVDYNIYLEALKQIIKNK